MTINQMRETCIRELLFGRTFLTDYQRELNELSNDPSFVQTILDISESVSPETEFSTDPFSKAFLQFKKENINSTFFNENLKFRFSAYRDIVDSVVRRGKTRLSAAISVYYAIRYLTMENVSIETVKQVSICENQPSDSDYRQKWPAKFRCDDGHYVRSKNEQLLDNWFFHHGICHAYEMLVVDKRTAKEYISDFFIPKLDTYIEVWGYETDEYLQRKERKIEVYCANNLKLLQMTDKEIKSLDDYLRRNILVLL